MIKLESGSNGKPISFGQALTSLTSPVAPAFVSRPLPFEIEQVPTRVVSSLPLPSSLRPSVNTSGSSQKVLGVVGIGVILLILFLLRG